MYYERAKSSLKGLSELFDDIQFDWMDLPPEMPVLARKWHYIAIFGGNYLASMPKYGLRGSAQKKVPICTFSG